MTKRRKQKNQDWDEWEDAPDDTMVAEGNGDQFQVHLEDYVIKEKVSAFVRCYQLRDFFKATVCGLGDPLRLYIEDLKMAGFSLEVSEATGQLAMFVRKRF